MIRRISIISVFLLFALFGLFGILVAASFGWPKVRVTDLKGTERLICFACMFSTFVTSLGGSTLIYLLMLRQQGQLGNNQVASIPENKPTESTDLDLDEETEFQRLKLERLKVMTLNLLLYLLLYHGLYSFPG